MGLLPDEEQTNLNLLAGLTPQLEASTQALSRAQQDKSFAESQLSQQIAAWQASQSGQIRNTRAAARRTPAQLTILQSKYTDDHPDVIKAKIYIAAMQQRIAQENQQQKSATVDKTAKPLTEPAHISNFAPRFTSTTR